ncbi:hypothetical protein ACQIAD_20825, partial [Enterobacter hormaechei]
LPYKHRTQPGLQEIKNLVGGASESFHPSLYTFFVGQLAIIGKRWFLMFMIKLNFSSGLIALPERFDLFSSTRNTVYTYSTRIRV